MKDNKDFITDSIFGQFFQQLSMRDSEFSCLQNANSPFSVSAIGWWEGGIGPLLRLIE